MTSTTSALDDLLAECGACGIRLALADAGGLEIDAPQEALTSELLARLKAHKADLVAMLREVTESTQAALAAAKIAPAKPKTAVCWCGSNSYREVPIHDGQSVRRDCRLCGRFICFSIWYGKDTRQEG